MSGEFSYKIRPAEEEDLPHLYMAEYEKLLDIFEGSIEVYRRYGFSEDAIFDTLIAENTGDEGPDYYGMALYYYTYSTFTGRPTLWLDDTYVLEEYRGRGIGTSMLVELSPG